MAKYLVLLIADSNQLSYSRTIEVVAKGDVDRSKGLDTDVLDMYLEVQPLNDKNIMDELRLFAERFLQEMFKPGSKVQTLIIKDSTILEWRSDSL